MAVYPLKIMEFLGSPRISITPDSMILNSAVTTADLAGFL